MTKLLMVGIVSASLVGCGGDDDKTPDPARDVNDFGPYLTDQPSLTPTSGLADASTVTYTVSVDGPNDVSTVYASLTPFAAGTGFAEQAFATLSLSSGSTWTGQGTIDASSPLLVGQDGYFMTITIEDSTGASTSYLRDFATSGTHYNRVTYDENVEPVDEARSQYTFVTVHLQ